MCKRWPCCLHAFNIARLDPATGRFMWQRLCRTPGGHEHLGWHAIAIAALPTTDDAVVLITVADGSVGQAIWLQRIRSDGSIVWERLVRPVTNSLNGRTLGFTEFLDCNDTHIFCGTPAFGRDVNFDPDPDLFAVFTHDGERIPIPSHQGASQVNMPVLAHPDGGCFVGRGTHLGLTILVRSDAEGTPIWEDGSNTYPVCFNAAGNVLATDYNSLVGGSSAALYDSDDGTLLAETTIGLSVATACGVLFGNEFWIGTSAGGVRLDSESLAPLGTINSVDQVAVTSLTVSQENCVVAVAPISGFFARGIVRFEPDGEPQWGVSWGTKNGPPGYLGSLGLPMQICTTRDGNVLVCGEQAFR